MGRKEPMDVLFDDDKNINIFLKKHQHILSEEGVGKCNKYSLDIVLSFNEYKQQYDDFMRLGHVVLYFLREMDLHDLKDNVYARWLRILCSLKKQKMFYDKLKNISKKIPLSKQDYNSIKRGIEYAGKRITYIYEKILPEYLNITPVYSYLKKLEKESISFFEDSAKYIDYSVSKEDFYFSEESQKKLAGYCNMIMEESGSEWEENLAQFKSVYEKRMQKIQAVKDKEKEEKKKKKSEEAQDYLDYYASKVSKNINDIVVGNKRNCYPYSRVISRMSIFSVNRKTCKIILFLNSTCRSANAVRYFSKETDGYIGPLTKATVVDAKFEIPDELAQKIADNNMVISELILN